MNIFKEAIKNEEKRILRLADLTAPPEEIERLGSLSPEPRGQHIYCYEKHYQGGGRSDKTYLGTPDSEAVQRHIKLRMQGELAKRLEANRKVLKRAMIEYQDYDAETLLDALPASYRKIVGDTPAYLFFDDRYQDCVRWAARDWKRNEAPFTRAATYARDGTRNRSKGECIYYNMLQEHWLPFVYDSYMSFRDERGEPMQACPDFAIRCLSGRLIIIEHLGLLNDLGYAYNFGKKCQLYIANGFVLGRDFFVTGDDAHGGTDSQAIQDVIGKVEDLFYHY